MQSYKREAVVLQQSEGGDQQRDFLAPHQREGNHRTEVNLTVREVVLSTIHENPDTDRNTDYQQADDRNDGPWQRWVTVLVFFFLWTLFYAVSFFFDGFYFTLLFFFYELYFTLLFLFYLFIIFFEGLYYQENFIWKTGSCLGEKGVNWLFHEIDMHQNIQ